MSLQLRSGSRELIREINESLVLNTIRERGPISRTNIAEVTHLSLATISGITSMLIEQGLIYEHEPGVSTGGRRPILLALNPHGGFVIGVKLTDTHIVAALTDMYAEVVAQRTAPLGDDHRPAAVVAVVADTVHALRERHPGRRVFGLGLGMAGVIDRRAGICRFSPFSQWRDVPFGAMLEQALDLPVVLENDANTLTLAEQWFGTGIGVPDFLVITLGRGIGMGMVLNGELYRGGCGGGGEFGHLTMMVDGPHCECGKRGCLEALVADRALLQRLQTAFGRSLTLEDGASLARQGDVTAHGIFAAAGRTLGFALAHLVNIFNPPLIVVGGEGARTLDLLREPLQETLQAHCFNGFFNDVRLVAEPWGDDAWARGAASLTLEELFRPTLYRDDRTRTPRGVRVGERSP